MCATNLTKYNDLHEVWPVGYANFKRVFNGHSLASGCGVPGLASSRTNFLIG